MNPSSFPPKKSDVPNHQVHSNNPPKEAPQSLFSWATSVAISTANTLKNTAYTLTNVVTSKSSDKQQTIDQAEITILSNLSSKDAAMFLQLSNLIGGAASKGAEEALGKWTTTMLDAKMLLKVFVTQSFANLSTKLNEEKENIPNYATQPALLSLFSLFAKNTSNHLNKKILINLEKKHQFKEKMLLIDQEKVKIAKLVNKKAELEKKLSAIMESSFTEDDLEYVRGKIEEYKKYAEYPGMRSEIETEIFQNFTEEQKKEALSVLSDLEDITRKITNPKELMTLEATLSDYEVELKEIFNQVAGDILYYIFPQGYSDPAIQKFVEGEIIYDKILSSLQSAIGNILYDQYSSLQKDTGPISAWNENLHAHSDGNIDSLVGAPSMLLQGVTKHFLEFSTSVASMTTSALQGLQGTSEKTAPLTEADKKAVELDSLNLKNLSNWIVESVQDLGQTTDPDLQGLLSYGTGILTNLTTSLLGKAVTELIPEGELIKKGEILNTLFEKASEKVSVAMEQKSLSSSLSIFVSDLPIPAIIKHKIVSTLNETAIAEEKLPTLIKQVNALHDESKKQLESIPSGDVIYSLIENLSNQLIKYVKDQNTNLLSADLEKTIDKLLIEYMPGLVLDPALTLSLKENIQGFSSKQPLDFVKKGIQTILTQGILGAISEDFDPKVSIRDQFLGRLTDVFEKKFSNLTADEKVNVQKAFAIQKNIDDKTALAQKLDLNASKRVSNATVEMQQASDTVLFEFTRVESAKEIVVLLRKNLTGIFEKLNANPNQSWDLEKLAELQNSKILPKDNPLLSSLSSDSLKLISEAMDIVSTLKHAENEQAIRTDALFVSVDKFEAMEKEPGFKKLQQRLLARFSSSQLNEEITELNFERDKYLSTFRGCKLEPSEFLIALRGPVGKQKNPTLKKNNLQV